MARGFRNCLISNSTDDKNYSWNAHALLNAITEDICQACRRFEHLLSINPPYVGAYSISSGLLLQKLEFLSSFKVNNSFHMSAPEKTEDDDGVVERESVQGRYVRYGEQIGRGRFKAVYRGFDEKLGMDVAWAKIDGTENHLTQPELEQVLREVEDGQKLKHDNVINYYLVRGWSRVLLSCSLCQMGLIRCCHTEGILRPSSPPPPPPPV